MMGFNPRHPSVTWILSTPSPKGWECFFIPFLPMAEVTRHMINNIPWLTWSWHKWHIARHQKSPDINGSHFAGPRLITLHRETTRSRNKTNNTDILISVLRIMNCTLNIKKIKMLVISLIDNTKTPLCMSVIGAWFAGNKAVDFVAWGCLKVPFFIFFKSSFTFAYF